MAWVYHIQNSDAPTDAAEIIAVAVAMTVVALVVVTMRIYVRWGILNVFGIDDGIVMFSWFASFGFTTITCIQTRYGLGLHNISDLPPENIQGFNKLQFAGAPFYILGILSFKLSLLFAYMRFMPQGNYRIATYVVIILTTLFHLSFLFTQVNLCDPIQAQWDTSIQNYTCLPPVLVYTTMASLTILFDVIVMALPFPVLLSLKMQDRKKIVILGLFGLGVFITVIQIVRLQTVRRLTNLTDSAPLITWSCVEVNLGIIVASVPCLSPLIKYFRDRVTTASRSRRKTGIAGYRVGSQYALQTWEPSQGGSTAGGGSRGGELGIATPTGGLVSVTRGSDSTDSEVVDSTGIVRKTEITITRE